MGRTGALKRLSVVLVGAVAVALSLTGCLPDRPASAIQWLGGQAGVTETSILESDNGEFQSTGIVRGELKPDIDDADLSKLTNAVAGYEKDHPEVSIRLGRGSIDFAVSTDSATTSGAVQLWRRVLGLGHISNAIVRDNAVHARALRSEAVLALGALDDLGADITLEALADDAAIATDTQQDNTFDDDYFNIDALAVKLPRDCTPSDAERTLIESFFARPEIDGGILDLCKQLDLYYVRDAALATFVPQLYGQLADASLLELPVNVHQIAQAAPDGHLITVTPASPEPFTVLSTLESAGIPEFYYTLYPDGSLEVIEYDTPTADLLALVSQAPVAGSLAGIRIEGESTAIGGTLDQLPGLLDEATALAASSDIFTNVELQPTYGTLALSSPVATDPDVVAAAAALRASGAWQGRDFQVKYLSMSATITDGVATVDDSYTDPHVLADFVTAWAASA